MLDLSPETEALAQRLADDRRSTVDETVRAALQVEALRMLRGEEKDMSPEAIAKRIDAVNKIVSEIAALPILDPRPVQEIVDDINEV